MSDERSAWLAAEAARLFDLGTVTAAMTPMSGGLSHRMWKLTTSRGRFAVKEVNRNFDDPTYVDWYERAFRFEMRAYDVGVPMPRPVAVATTGLCLGEVQQDGGTPVTLRAHEWSDARPYGDGDSDVVCARKVGALLAQLHALDEPCAVNADDRLRVLGAEHWASLAERLRAQGVEWVDDVDAALPYIAALERMVEASANEPAHVILSHRDADPKNILIEDDGRVLLIDWDAVGPVAAQQDVAQEAISWATQRTRMPEPDVLRAFVAGYREAGGVLQPPQPADIAEFWNVMMRWCAFNLRRVLGERLQDESDREMANYHARRVVGGFEQWRALPEVWAAALE